MQQPGQGGFLNTIARQFKRLAQAFKEKPQAKLDDYLLEHFMVYHGLVGTSEESRPKFKELKAFVWDALHNKSSAEMAIALKVPPLENFDQLESIFDEAREHFEWKLLLHCLLPEADPLDVPPEHVPLSHPDWRVRANAARALAHLRAMEAVPHLVQALNDTSEDMRSSFLHIAYSLAELQNPQARMGLVPHLNNEEQWFRVDAAGALAGWSLQEVAHDLMLSMTQLNVLNDYMSVVIARKHPPAELLQLKEPVCVQGALEVVIGLVQAAGGPFAGESGRDTSLFETMETVAEIARTTPSPRSLRAVLLVAEWTIQAAKEIRFGADDRIIDRALECAKTAGDEFTAPVYKELLTSWLGKVSPSGTTHVDAELRHALDLAARYHLSDAGTTVTSLLRADHPAINEILDATGSLRLGEASDRVVAIINTIVDLDARTSRELSKQPVFEENPAAAKTYWHALRALGSLPTALALDILLKASNDFAADKRQQAITSLIALGAAPEMSGNRARVQNTVGQALSDPASSVKVSALRGVGDLHLTDLANETARLAATKDPGVSREAISTLKRLSESGHQERVRQVLQAELAGERDQYRRERLQTLLDSLK